MDVEITGSKLWMINFYREQLRKFDKVGLGKFTEHDVKVTDELVAITNKRLRELTTIYDSSISRNHKLRKRRAERKLFNGQQCINNNGTTITSRMQNNGNTRYARKKS